MSIISNILMLNKIHDGEELLVAVREMDHACAVGRGHIGIGRAVSRLALTVGLRCFRAFLALGSAMALSGGGAVAEDLVDQSGTAYILNLDHLQPQTAADGSPVLETWAGFSAVSSPTGVFLPDASAYFDLDGGNDRVTYLTPRYQGVQVSWTGDRSTEAADPRGRDTSSSRTYITRPTSVGASFAQQEDDFEVSLGGDYGRTPKSVPGAIRLVDDHKLLRLGAHARIQEFTLGAAFGGDIDPGDLGDTLSWDAFGRYDFGSLSVGFVYNYTVETDESSGDGNNIPGTLQGGVSYFFTPRMAVTTNLAYGNSVDQDGSDEAGIAGVLGFSLDF